MKVKEHIQYFTRFWVIGLVVALIIIRHLSATGAQVPKSKIITIGADDTFEQSLAQPTQFLQRMGSTPEEIQKQLKARPHIFVGEAGFVRNLEMTSFTSVPPIQTSIQVEGSGSARIVGLTVFTEVADQQSSKLGIHVVDAGFVHNISLVAPLGQ